ncbi:phage tail tube protein [Streptomyces violascens]
MAADAKGNDAGRIRFAPDGALYFAPLPKSGTGPTPPTDCGVKGVAPNGYTPMGYVDEGGVTITPSISSDPVKVWQSAVPVLYNVKEASFQVKATLLETNLATTELFFGAEWKPATERGSNGVERPIKDTWRLDLSSTPELSEISLVVDWSQGAVQYRAVIERAMISDRGAIQLQRAEAGKYELTIEALDASGRLGYILTNDAIKDGAVLPGERFQADLSQATVKQGGEVHVTGKGAKPNAAVTVTTGDPKLAADAGNASPTGAFDIRVTVTEDARLKDYTISASDGDHSAQAGTLTVEAKPQTV